VTATSGTFAWSSVSTDVVSWSSWLDKESPKATTLRTSSVSNLTIGDHTFHVVATDRAGNTAKGSFSFAVAAPPKATDILLTPSTDGWDELGNSITLTRSATPVLAVQVSYVSGEKTRAVFNVVSDSGVVVAGQLAGEWVPFGSSSLISSVEVPVGFLEHGRMYSAQVVRIEASSNGTVAATGATVPEPVSFRVDLVAPARVDVYSPVFLRGLRTLEGTAGEFSWESEADDIAYYEYWLDASAPDATTDPAVELAPSVGTHTLHVIGVDAAGNQSATASYGFTVVAAADSPPHVPHTATVSPTVILDGDVVVTSGTPTFEATASDPDGGAVGLEFGIWQSEDAQGSDPSISAMTLVQSGAAGTWILPERRVEDAEGGATYESQLTTGRAYVWRVRATDGVQSSDWTDPRPLIRASGGVNRAPSAVHQSISPSSVDVSSGRAVTDVVIPTFSASVADADGGEVRVRFQVFTSGQLVSAGVSDYVSVEQATTSWQPARGELQHGIEYQWRVQAFDALATSSWSDLVPFSVDLPPNRAPRVEVPSVAGQEGDGENDGQYVYSFSGAVVDPDRDSVALEVEVFTADSGVSVFSVTSPFIEGDELASIQVPTAALEVGRSYNWRYRAFDGTMFSQWVEHPEPLVAESPLQDDSIEALRVSDGLATTFSTPVLLVHGLQNVKRPGENCADRWKAVVASLKSAGFKTVQTVGYYGWDRKCDINIGRYQSPNWHGNYWRNTGDHGGQNAGHTADAHIAHLAHHFNAMVYERWGRQRQRVAIVSHSMGGLIVRWALASSQGGSTGFEHMVVSDSVTLGTPHSGRPYADIGASEQTNDLAPDSRFMKLLNADRSTGLEAQGYGGTDWTLIGSGSDRWVSTSSAIGNGKKGPNHDLKAFNAKHKTHYYYWGNTYDPMGHSEYRQNHRCLSNCEVYYSHNSGKSWSGPHKAALDIQPQIVRALRGKDR
jgi:hypothetical protein